MRSMLAANRIIREEKAIKKKTISCLKHVCHLVYATSVVPSKLVTTSVCLVSELV